MTEEMTKLCLGADYYSNINPAMARACMNSVEQAKTRSGITRTSQMRLCPYCQQVLRPGNHSKSIIPRMKLTKKIAQIQDKAKRHGTQSLGKFQKNLLNRYQTGFNYFSVHCNSCEGKTKLPLYARPHKDLQKNGSKAMVKDEKNRVRKVEQKQDNLPAANRSSSKKKTASSETKSGLTNHSATTSHSSFKSLSKVVSDGKKSKHKNVKSSFNKLQQMLENDNSSRLRQSHSLTSFLESL